MHLELLAKTIYYEKLVCTSTKHSDPGFGAFEMDLK